MCSLKINRKPNPKKRKYVFTVRNYAQRSLYRAGKQAPPWVTMADILPIYEEAAKLGPEYAVCHIIPLRYQRPNVYGLHVPANLEIRKISKDLPSPVQQYRSGKSNF